MKRRKTVLTIAGSDGSGGAGIQADIKTITANGCYALSVITAITEQNTAGVRKTWPIPPECIIGQFKALADDMHIDAIKIGMLCNMATLSTVAALLEKLPESVPIVLDTVLRSTSGAPLLDSNALPSFRDVLLPHATLITPNLPETAELLRLKDSPSGTTETERAAAGLIDAGAQAVLIKGGHAKGTECRDYLYNRHEGGIWFSAPRIDTQNTHGTGCTLSSAIASNLAKGETLRDAVSHAKEYLTRSIIRGREYQMGKGEKGPLEHQ